MAITKKWDGIGATNGPMTASSAGSSDNVFNAVTTGLTVSNGSIVVPVVTNTDTTYVRWNDLNLNTWSTRCYIQFDGNANGIAHVIYAWGTTNARIWSVSLNTSRLVQFRNAAGSAVGAGYTITLGVRYRFEIRGQSGTDSATFKVFDDSGVEVYTLTTAIGTTLGLLHVQYGRQQSSVQFGPASYSNLRIDNTNATIGAYVPPPQTAAPWVVLNSNGTVTPLTLNGMWNGTSILPLDLGQVTPIGVVNPPTAYRVPWQYPFASDSVWNTSIGSGATYLATNDAAGQHSEVVNSKGGINSYDWSDPVYLATNSDPLVTVEHRDEYLPAGWQNLTNTQTGTTTGAGPWVKEEVARIPLSARWQNDKNTDRKVHVVQPDGITSIEIHKFYRTSDPARIFCTNLSKTDLRYSGLNGGAIASQISPTGGLIRNFEVAAAKIDIHAISHVLRIGMTGSMLKVGWIWPSKNQDGNTSTHTGKSYYGTMLALDKAVDIETLRYPSTFNGGRLLNTAEKALAYCLQDYGGYVLIRSGDPQYKIIGLQVEARNVDKNSSNDLVVQDMRNAWREVFVPKLRVITNSADVGPLSLTGDRTPQNPALIAGGGTRRRPALPPIDPTTSSPTAIDQVVCWGDSLTEGSTGDNWPSQLATMLGVSVFNQGKSGMGTSDIALRQGGLIPLVTVTGNSIPANTTDAGGPGVHGVAVTAISPTTGWRRDGSGTFSRAGVLAGVPGTLINDLVTNSFRFHRTTPAASATNISSASPFVGSELLVNHQRMISVFWTGRNSMNALTQVVTNTQKMVDFLTPSPKEYVVLGVTNTSSEPSGSANHNAIISVNNSLAAAHPSCYIDIRGYLISSGLAAAGITPTSQDNTDIGNDVIPSSLRSDSTHLNADGKTLVANRVKAFIQSKGWV